MQSFTQQQQHGGIPSYHAHDSVNYRISSIVNNWNKRVSGRPPLTRVALHAAHVQHQNIQNVNIPRRLQMNSKPRPSTMVHRNSRPPLAPLRNNGSTRSSFHPSFKVPPRFLRDTGPVNAVAYAPAPTTRTSNVPSAIIHNLPPSFQQNFVGSGVSDHSSECSEDDDDDLFDVQVQDLVTKFLEGLTTKANGGGLDMNLNVLLNRDVSNSKAILPLEANNRESSSKLREHIRTTALMKFEEHWKPGGHWQIEAIIPPITRKPNARKGVSIASFITALFIAKVISTGDFQDCLYSLIAHPVHFDRLCAMHAMVTHANLRLCTDKHWLRTKAFRDRLGAVDSRRNPDFMWARDGPSSFFVMDIIATLDRWRCTAVMNDMRRATKCSSA